LPFGEDGGVTIFETLREQISVEEIVAENSGAKGIQACCANPYHPDDNPSMHVYEDHVHCYACGFHGVVVGVWAAQHGFERPIEAALDLAREYGVELPETSPEAQRKAQDRRKKEDLYLRQARACHKALSCYGDVAEYWEERGFGEQLRERYLLGADKDGTMAVIPFWNRGRVKGLIRRKLEGEPRYIYPRAEEFPEGHRPLFIPAAVRAGAFLVEGIVDALALGTLGENAIATGGTAISQPQMRELKRLAGPLYILPDAGESGAEAAREWARELYPKALVCPAEYGEGVTDDAS